MRQNPRSSWSSSSAALQLGGEGGLESDSERSDVAHAAFYIGIRQCLDAVAAPKMRAAPRNASMNQAMFMRGRRSDDGTRTGVTLWPIMRPTGVDRPIIMSL